MRAGRKREKAKKQGKIYNEQKASTNIVDIHLNI